VLARGGKVGKKVPCWRRGGGVPKNSNNFLSHELGKKSAVWKKRVKKCLGPAKEKAKTKGKPKTKTKGCV